MNSSEVTEAHTMAYAHNTGLDAYLKVISASIDEFEALAATAQRTSDIGDSTAFHTVDTTGARPPTSSRDDWVACALNAAVLHFGDDMNDAPTHTSTRTKAGRAGASRSSSGPAEERGTPSTTSNRSLPAGDGAFSTRDAAVKAEVCRSLAEFTEGMLSGRLALPAELSWKHAVSDDSWVGVSLAFQTAQSLRHVAAPAFAHTCGVKTPSPSPPRAGSPSRETTSTTQQSLFFRALLLPVSSTEAPHFDEDAEFVARVCLRAHCPDIPDSLWRQVVTLARAATSVLQAATRSTDHEEMAMLRPVRADVILLRCLLLHMVSPTAFSLVTTFRNRAVRTFTTPAVCADRGPMPRHVVEGVLAVEASVTALLDSVAGVDSACLPQPILIGAVLSKAFWAWASRPYSTAWAQYYVG